MYQVAGGYAYHLKASNGEICVSIVTRKKIINAILICAPIAVTSRKIISKISSQANSAFVLVVKTSLILI